MQYSGEACLVDMAVLYFFLQIFYNKILELVYFGNVPDNDCINKLDRSFSIFSPNLYSPKDFRMVLLVQ